MTMKHNGYVFLSFYSAKKHSQENVLIAMAGSIYDHRGDCILRKTNYMFSHLEKEKIILSVINRAFLPPKRDHFGYGGVLTNIPFPVRIKGYD